MDANKKFNAARDAGTDTRILAADADSPELAEEIAQSSPPLLIGALARGGDAQFTVNLAGRLPKKGFRVSVVNAEKYKGCREVRQEVLADLVSRVSSTSPRQELSRIARHGKSRPRRTGGGAAVLRTLAVLGTALVLFAALLALGWVLELEQLQPFLPKGSAYGLAAAGTLVLTALAVGIFALTRLTRRPPDTRALERALSRALVSGRNGHIRHIVVFLNAVRLDNYTQLALYNSLSSLLPYNPMTFVILLSDSAADSFRAYFRDCLSVGLLRELPPERPASAATPAVKAILESVKPPELVMSAPHALERGEDKPRLSGGAKAPETLSGTERPARIAAEQSERIDKTPSPARITEQEKPKQLMEKFRRPEESDPGRDQLDMLDNLPAKEAQDASFDFAAATTKDIMHALADGSLAGLDGFEILYGALPKIYRMPEKTLNEYLTMLSYTVKKLDLYQTDFSRAEGRVWAKFIGWYAGLGEQAKLSGLYKRALADANAEALLAFLPGLTDEQEKELEAALSARCQTCFQTGEGFDALIPVIAAPEGPNVREAALCAAEKFCSDSGRLAGKGDFVYSFSSLLAALEPRMADEDFTAVYRFVTVLLTDFEDSRTTAAGMRVISAYKEKFRFHGLSIEALNDIIFNKDFADVTHKLEYIDSLLSSPSLSDAEKNRYVSYLTSTQDTLSPPQRIMVLQSLIKSGVKVERENILEAVKWVREDRSQDFLDALTNLLRAFSSLKGAKNEGIFADIAKQGLSVSERSKILRAYFSAGYNDTQRIARQLLALCMSEDEALAELDCVDVVLASLAPLAASSRLPKNEFVETVSHLLEHEENLDRYKKILHTLAVRYDRLALNGDQKHDLKSGMFKGAANFDADLSVETSVILKVFKIEYISFVEQKIAKQGDPDVEESVREALAAIERERG